MPFVFLWCVMVWKVFKSLEVTINHKYTGSLWDYFDYYILNEHHSLMLLCTFLEYIRRNTLQQFRNYFQEHVPKIVDSDCGAQTKQCVFQTIFKVVLFYPSFNTVLKICFKTIQKPILLSITYLYIHHWPIR